MSPQMTHTNGETERIMPEYGTDSGETAYWLGSMLPFLLRLRQAGG